MKENITQAEPGGEHPQPNEAFEWNISVDVTQIDFMGPDVLFAAGSTSDCHDCSLISQMPLQRRRRRGSSV